MGGCPFISSVVTFLTRGLQKKTPREFYFICWGWRSKSWLSDIREWGSYPYVLYVHIHICISYIHIHYMYIGGERAPTLFIWLRSEIKFSNSGTKPPLPWQLPTNPCWLFGITWSPPLCSWPPLRWNYRWGMYAYQRSSTVSRSWNVLVTTIVCNVCTLYIQYIKVHTYIHFHPQLDDRW